MMKIGRDKVLDKHGNEKISRYQDCEKDFDGWVKAKDFLPIEYDLVSLKLDDGRIIKGWLSLNQFDGLKLKDNDKVIFWKKHDL